MKHLTIIFLVFLLASCGGNSGSANAPVEDANRPPTSGYTSPAPPPIPFTGDACEYAKLAFIQAYQEYQKHLGDQVLHERQQQARLAVEAVCGAEAKEESKTWACAEGHSCR